MSISSRLDGLVNSSNKRTVAWASSKLSSWLCEVVAKNYSVTRSSGTDDRMIMVGDAYHQEDVPNMKQFQYLGRYESQRSFRVLKWYVNNYLIFITIPYLLSVYSIALILYCKYRFFGRIQKSSRDIWNKYPFVENQLQTILILHQSCVLHLCLRWNIVYNYNFYPNESKILSYVCRLFQVLSNFRFHNFYLL